MSNYKQIQIPTIAYHELKVYCQEHDKKMGKTVAKWIHEKTNPPKHVLPSVNKNKIFKTHEGT